MKRIFMALFLFVTPLFILCLCQSVSKAPIPIVPPNATIDLDNSIVNIPIDAVKGLSSDEAITLCQKVIGTKDNDQFLFKMSERHTNRDIGYFCDTAIEYDDKQYYVLCMLWSSGDDVNWSNIGFVGVSSDGNNIHELFNHSDGSYSFGKLLWTRE